MTEPKERINVVQVHDNDKYIVTRTIVEEMDGQRLLSVYEEIRKARTDREKQLEEIPKQMEERIKVLKREIKTVSDREEAFKQHASRIKETEPKPEPVEQKKAG